MMKPRYIGIALLAWLVLIIGYGLTHSGAHRSAKGGATETTATSPLPAGTPTSTTGSSSTTPVIPIPDTSVPGGGKAPTPNGAPPAAPGVKQLPPQITQQTEQQNVAVSGWPAVSFLPFRGKTIKVEYEVFNGHQPLLSVTYSKSKTEALKELRAFLASHGDRIGHYRVTYVSPAVRKQRAVVGKRLDLAFGGFPLIMRLPDHYRNTTLNFDGKHGKNVWISYTGPKAAAEKRLDYWVKVYSDKRSHYTLVKR